MEPRFKLNRTVEPDAETVAIKALSFLAERPDDLGRFLALTGIDPSDLRHSAADFGFLGGILDFLLGDEALLIVFAEEQNLPPESIARARQRLDAPPPRD
jgi:hypothetical protein